MESNVPRTRSVGSLRAALRTRTDLTLENLALRQQLALLRRRSKRPQLGASIASSGCGFQPVSHSAPLPGSCRVARSDPLDLAHVSSKSPRRPRLRRLLRRAARDLPGTIEDMAEDDFRAQMETSFFGVVNVRGTAQGLHQRPRGIRGLPARNKTALYPMFWMIACTRTASALRRRRAFPGLGW